MRDLDRKVFQTVLGSVQRSRRSLTQTGFYSSSCTHMHGIFLTECCSSFRSITTKINTWSFIIFNVEYFIGSFSIWLNSYCFKYYKNDSNYFCKHVFFHCVSLTRILKHCDLLRTVGAQQDLCGPWSTLWWYGGIASWNNLTKYGRWLHHMIHLDHRQCSKALVYDIGRVLEETERGILGCCSLWRNTGCKQ